MKAARQIASGQPTPDDEALLARIAKRDSQALALLYERYARLVYSLARRILGNAELAEDIVQETFWRVWRRSETYRTGRGSVVGWISGIARNLSIDELRRQRARPSEVYDTEASPVLRDMVDGSTDVVAAALEDERRRLIEAALSQMTAEQRQAIELAYFGGLSQSEIAERLHSPIGTIKTRIRSGLRKLREILAAQQFGAEDLIE
jgi:RNA polymerase sigma-70 factor (ECF subfamily)